MRKKLLAYTINGQRIGIDIVSWKLIDLNGNDPFIAIDEDESIPANYVDISSLKNWDNFGNGTGLDDNVIQKNIVDLAEEIGDDNLNNEEKKILDEYTLTSNLIQITQENNFGTPSDIPLSTINTTYNNVVVYGVNTPDLSNVLSLTINYNLSNNGLYTFAINTDNGNPNWYYDLIPFVISNTLNQPEPQITISGTAINNLDGTYWVAKLGNDLVFDSIIGNKTLYFTNASDAYVKPTFNSTLVSVDENGKFLNTNIVPNLYGTEFQLISDESETNTNSTSPVEVLTLTTTTLPNGKYKIMVGWYWSHNAGNNSALFDIQINGETIGEQLSIEVKDTSNKYYEYLVNYSVLDDVNDITLRYWNEGGGTTISNKTIELIRIE